MYAICRDKWSLSLKNKWINEKGEIYFYANQQKMAEFIGVSRKTINEGFKKLIELGLLVKENSSNAKGRASIYYLCSIPLVETGVDEYQELDFAEEIQEEIEDCNQELQEKKDVTVGDMTCNYELQDKKVVTESYTNKTIYNVSIINRIRLINNNPIEGDQILRIFLEKKISEELISWILDFLEMRSKGEKIYIQEVKSVVSQLVNKYSSDEIRIKALEHAIASRHNSIVYEEKKESKGEKKTDTFTEMFGDRSKIVNFWKEEVL